MNTRETSRTIFLEHKDAPGGRERDLASQINTVPQQMKFSAYHRPPLHHNNFGPPKQVVLRRCYHCVRAKVPLIQ